METAARFADLSFWECCAGLSDRQGPMGVAEGAPVCIKKTTRKKWGENGKREIYKEKMQVVAVAEKGEGDRLYKEVWRSGLELAVNFGRQQASPHRRCPAVHPLPFAAGRHAVSVCPHP